MRTIQEWFDEYAVSHQNSTNKLIHWICVPVIVFSLMGLLMSIPFPLAEKSFFANWAFVVYAASMLFYWRLSQNIFRGLAIILAIFLWLNYVLLQKGADIFIISVILFVLAWVGQFIGHKIEGKKPSFLKDLQFLLIGPAWLLHFIYQKSGIKW